MKYRHKKTGMEYVWVEFWETRPRLCTVRTPAGSQYIVKTENIEAIRVPNDDRDPVVVEAMKHIRPYFLRPGMYFGNVNKADFDRVWADIERKVYGE